MKDLSDSVESMEQLSGVWRAIVLDRNAGSDVRVLPGLAVRWADCELFTLWNCITMTEVGADVRLLEKRLGEAVDVMRAKRNPGFLNVFEELLDDGARTALESAARDAGLTPAFPAVGMAGNILSDLTEPVHPDLTFTRVRTEEQLLAFADLNARANGMTPETGRDGWAGSALWKTEVYAYLASQYGVPVSCAAAVELDGRLCVMSVATPDLQRRGYAEAVSRKALYEGAQATGLTRATVHATYAGAPVYMRIGFKPISSLHFYTLTAG